MGKPFDIPKSPEKPLLKPDSKSESESKLSKHPKNLDEFAKNDHNKTKRDLETPNNKISTDKNTDHKPTSVPTLNQEDDKTKKDNLVVETKPEKPTEVESVEEELVISELPSYDLP